MAQISGPTSVTPVAATIPASGSVTASLAIPASGGIPASVAVDVATSDTTARTGAFEMITAPIESLIQSSTDLVRHQVIEMAKQYLGIRYVRGGQSEKGFDCSGFVSYVYSKLGLKIPRSSAQQSVAGQKIAKDATKAGDLVFFFTRGKNIISHVGIYIGDNKFIHAASSGKGVIISSLNEPYWKSRFSKAASFFTDDTR